MSVVFNGVTCYPIGDANLNIVSNKLRVSNIGSSGLDGIMFEVPTTGGPAGNDIAINHDYLFNSGDGSLTATLQGVTPNNEIFTMAETLTYKVGNEVFYGYNGKLLPQDDFKMIGLKNGNTVFDINTQNPYNPPSPPAQGLIGDIFKAAYYLYLIIKDIFFPPTTTQFITGTIVPLPNGGFQYDLEVTTDPIPVDVEVLGGQTYNVDTWGYKKTYIVPAAAGATITTFNKKRAVIFKMRDVADFDIYGITITPIQIASL
jgi:hypothetical protein